MTNQSWNIQYFTVGQFVLKIFIQNFKKFSNLSNSVNIWARKVFLFLNRSDFCQKLIDHVIKELRWQKCQIFKTPFSLSGIYIFGWFLSNWTIFQYNFRGWFKSQRLHLFDCSYLCAKKISNKEKMQFEGTTPPPPLPCLIVLKMNMLWLLAVVVRKLKWVVILVSIALCLPWAWHSSSPACSWFLWP